MTPFISLLTGAWSAILTHLWQTTLVLLLVLPLARALRRAPARYQEGVWLVGLLKLFLPLAVCGGIVRTVATAVLARPSGPGGLPGAFQLAAIRGVIDPIDAVLPPWWLSARLLEVAGSLAIVTWAGVAFLRLGALARAMHAAGREPAIADAQSLFSRIDGRARSRLLAALAGTGIPMDRVRIVSAAGLPRVEGLLRPRLVLPRLHLETLGSEELRAVLLHENEHRRRRDPLRFLLLHACGALLWFYPPVHWLRRRLQQAAEFACDEAVLRAGVHADDYSRALARTLRLELAPVFDPMSAGIGEGSMLRRRFERLSEPWRYRPMKRHALLLPLAVLLVAAGSFLPLPTRVDAIEPPASIAPAGAPTPGTEAPKAEQPPKVVRSVAPVYPEDARKAGAQGMVMLKVEILADGKIGAIDAIQEVEGYPSLTEAAIAAVRQWEFEPATSDGEPVATEVQIPIRYQLDTDGKDKKAGDGAGSK